MTPILGCRRLKWCLPSRLRWISPRMRRRSISKHWRWPGRRSGRRVAEPGDQQWSWCTGGPQPEGKGGVTDKVAEVGITSAEDEFLVGTLLADLLYSRLDPRVRME